MPRYNWGIKHFRQKETIQSSFDLLGEMVKFSYDACKQMDSILNTETKLKKAMIMVNNNLIDSNMFIRAMVLAAGHFIAAEGEVAEFARQSRLMKHFREFDKHVKFVVHLVSILKVTDLTQENVSCLNTSLVGRAHMSYLHGIGHLLRYWIILIKKLHILTPKWW